MNNIEHLDLKEKYDVIMQPASNNPKKHFVNNQTWEKRGDKFKQFSLFDYSKYSTSTKANINGENQKEFICQAGMR